VLDPAKLKSKCKYTPFDEARLQGRVVRTIVAGRTVYEYV
jgi:dihydroorotase